MGQLSWDMRLAKTSSPRLEAATHCTDVSGPTKSTGGSYGGVQRGTGSCKGNEGTHTCQGKCQTSLLQA